MGVARVEVTGVGRVLGTEFHFSRAATLYLEKIPGVGWRILGYEATGREDTPWPSSSPAAEGGFGSLPRGTG